MADAIKEYLFTLKPTFSKKIWNDTLDDVQELIENRLEKNKKSKAIQKLEEKTEVKIDKTLDSGAEKINKPIRTAGSIMLDSITLLRTVGKQIDAISETFKKVWEKANEVLEKSEKISNKFVTSSSMFVDKGVRDKMLQFGIGNTQAQAIISSESYMGISADDYATLGKGQRKAFNELMQHYQKGIESIDPEKLDAYNEKMQEFQLRYKELNMDIELAIMKLFVNSKPLEKLMNNVTEFIEDVVDVLSSDTAQFVFDTFINFLSSVIKMLSYPLKLFGAGGNNNTNNDNRKTINTYNQYNMNGTATTNPLYNQMAIKTPLY